MSNSHHKDDLYAIDLSGATWRKSPFSDGGENCVEITELPGGGVAVRDSKNPERGALRYTPEEWHAFRQGLIDGLL
ncbi:hypothetical protein SSP35_08_00350 [Streptomyces sp. NBRC 110611]|uniref:DUF397 domain-containing protein n=1 Tax=Streptomyces sp. NBRC 110611 TaxID=1621259 RepID=UPI00082F34BC|nr:DUF397 domain-containing protein [Streptomyces sp. NBRC 110611]GAU68541.1 hypothetical protein SSP35_08_00350 [Streptomyces sp. NBRC 110611]